MSPPPPPSKYFIGNICSVVLVFLKVCMCRVIACVSIYVVEFQEKTAVLQSLKERAKLVANTLNSMRNIKCNEVTGSMYAFPQIFLPQKAIEKAKVISFFFHDIFTFCRYFEIIQVIIGILIRNLKFNNFILWKKCFI